MGKLRGLASGLLAYARKSGTVSSPKDAEELISLISDLDNHQKSATLSAVRKELERLSQPNQKLPESASLTPSNQLSLEQIHERLSMISSRIGIDVGERHDIS